MRSLGPIGFFIVVVGATLIKHPSAIRQLPEIAIDGTVKAGQKAESIFDQSILRILTMSPKRRRLEDILRRLDNPVVGESAQVRAETAWSDEIVPQLREEWELFRGAPDSSQRQALSNICNRYDIRSTRPEEIPKSIVALGTDDENSEFFADVQFLIDFLGHGVTSEHVLCLLHSKVSTDLLDSAAQTWGDLAPTKFCLNTILEESRSNRNCV